MHQEITFTWLSEHEKRVWDVLSRHRGRDSAITGSKLSAITGVPSRTMRRTIRDLIDRGFPIGSLPHPPPGYFVIATRDELIEVCEYLYGQSMSHLVRVMHLKKWRARRMLRQLEMDLEA